RVPEELQELIGGDTDVLIGVRPVHQGHRQLGGHCRESELLNKLGQIAVGVHQHGPRLRRRGRAAWRRCHSPGRPRAVASGCRTACTWSASARWSSTARGGSGCCCATSCASERPLTSPWVLPPAR